MTIDTDALPQVIPTGKEKEGGNGGLYSGEKKLATCVILSTESKELQRDSYSCKQEVKLMLTRNEVIVLKKSSENPSKFSVVRKHLLKSIRASELEECLAPNAIVFEVPGTVLCHVYQLQGVERANVKEWLTCVHRCKDELQPAMEEASECDIPKPVNGCVRPSCSDSSCMTPKRPPGRLPSLQLQRSFSTPNSPVSTRSLNHLRSDAIIEDTPESSLERHGSVDGGISQHEDGALPIANLEPSSSFNRASSDRALGRRKVIKARRQILRQKTPSSSDISTLEGPLPRQESSSPEPEDSESPESSRVATPPNRSDLQSPFRHTQIRRGHKMVSPRITRGGSVQPPRSSTPSEKYSRANSTPSVVFHSSTLPRRKKSKDRADARLDQATSPDVPNSPKHFPVKSPKFLKLLHRRWNSSTGIKLHSTDDGYQASPSLPKKLHQQSPKDLAEELTLLDAELLRKINSQEVENGAWMDKTKKAELAPNVMAMVHSFNRLALLVPTEILEEKTPQARAKVISAFIQIASKCYSLRNYNSLKAILAGLQCTPIYRLDRTWKELPSKRRKRFKQLCCVMSEEENWTLYREDLKETIVSGRSYVPFFGLFLTEIVQQESYTKMRRDARRRSSSFESSLSKKQSSCVRAEVEKEGATAKPFQSCPRGRSTSEDEEEADGAFAQRRHVSRVSSRSVGSEPTRNSLLSDEPRTHSLHGRLQMAPTALLLARRSSLATSESSVDSKSSTDDYLKRRRSTSTPVKTPNGFRRTHLPESPSCTSDHQDSSLSCSFDGADYDDLAEDISILNHMVEVSDIIPIIKTAHVKAPVHQSDENSSLRDNLAELSKLSISMDSVFSMEDDPSNHRGQQEEEEVEPSDGNCDVELRQHDDEAGGAQSASVKRSKSCSSKDVSSVAIQVSGVPSVVLRQYQLNSLRYCADVESRVYLREFILSCSPGSEKEMYELSCEREPLCTCT